MTLLSIASCQAGTMHRKRAECKSARVHTSQRRLPPEERKACLPPASRKGDKKGLVNVEEDGEASLKEDI